MLPVTLQSQREDPDAIYGTVDDDVYAAVGNTGQSYYSMVYYMHPPPCMHVIFVCVCVWCDIIKMAALSHAFVVNTP